jgi:hypothetical protein
LVCCRHIHSIMSHHSLETRVPSCGPIL